MAVCHGYKFPNIIFNNISETLFMCIPNYFKLLSRAELKIPTESKVKEKYV